MKSLEKRLRTKLEGKWPQIIVKIDEIHAKKWCTVYVSLPRMSMGNGELRSISQLCHNLITSTRTKSLQPCYPGYFDQMALLEDRIYPNNNCPYLCWLPIPPLTSKDFESFRPNGHYK